jgi:D-alanine-D-alanine ligase
LTKQLKKIKPDLVVNLVEELNNQCQFVSFVPALLEQMAIPYTGAPAEALYITTNKILTKRLLKQFSLPTPNWYENQNVTSGRYIIKAIYEHASFALDESSILKVNNVAQLRTVLKDKKNQYGSEFFAEQYIAGREFNVAIIGNSKSPQILPIAEMCFVNDACKILTYKAKWQEHSKEYQNSVRNFVFKPEDQDLLAMLAKISLQCWQAFKLSGYARIDFRIDKDNQPYILEINANPCLAPDAGFIAAALQNQQTSHNIIQQIINIALEQKEELWN